MPGSTCPGTRLTEKEKRGYLPIAVRCFVSDFIGRRQPCKDAVLHPSGNIAGEHLVTHYFERTVSDGSFAAVIAQAGQRRLFGGDETGRPRQRAADGRNAFQYRAGSTQIAARKTGRRAHCPPACPLLWPAARTARVNGLRLARVPVGKRTKIPAQRRSGLDKGSKFSECSPRRQITRSPRRTIE